MGATSVVAYATVQALCRALYADLLTPDLQAALMRAPDLETLLSQLRLTAYAPHLEIARQLLTPRRIVYQLRQRLGVIYGKLIRFTPEPGRDLILELWRLYEIDNLKAVLRGIASGATWSEVRFLLAPMPHHTALPLDTLLRLLETRDMSRAIGRLRGLPYYPLLSQALPQYEARRTLFPLEISLDLGYRRALWRCIARLPNSDRAPAEQLLGALLDADNLLWALRFRLYYHLSEEEIINYTLTEHAQITPDEIRAIARSDDLAGILPHVLRHIPAVQQLTLSQHGTLLPPGTWLPALEQILYAHVREQCRQTFREATFHIGLPLAYLILAEYELHDLTAIIESHAVT